MLKSLNNFSFSFDGKKFLEMREKNKIDLNFIIDLNNIYSEIFKIIDNYNNHNNNLTYSEEINLNILINAYDQIESKIKFIIAVCQNSPVDAYLNLIEKLTNKNSQSRIALEHIQDKKDIILTYAANCIYSQQETGFNNQSSGSATPSEQIAKVAEAIGKLPPRLTRGDTTL